MINEWEERFNNLVGLIELSINQQFDATPLKRFIEENFTSKSEVGVQPEVMPKIADVVIAMKKKIWSSLSEYLAGENVPPDRIKILNLMAENECRICDELFTEIKNNFTA